VPTFRELIEVRKEIKVSRKPYLCNGNHSIDLRVRSEHAGLSVFVRQSVALVENFSIGLRFEVPGEDVAILLRVNGNHGMHKNPDGTVLRGPHTHEPLEMHLGLSPWGRYDPKQGRQLDQKCCAIVNGWEVFCQIANVAKNAQVASAITKLHNELAQEKLRGLFD
jgi:hypothetical protein